MGHPLCFEKMRLNRWFIPILVALLGILIFATPVAASVEQPTTLEIQEIEAFENTREDGDQLYIAKYYIAQNSTYNARQLYIFRLFDEDDNELKRGHHTAWERSTPTQASVWERWRSM